MIRHPITAIIGGLARGRVRRQTIRELNALSDRQLTDIGIDRAAIPAIVDARLSTAPAANKAPLTWSAETVRLTNAMPQSA